MYGRVEETVWLTPALARVVLAGSGLDGFAPVPYTDAYVNVAIPPAGAPYAAPFDVHDVQRQFPDKQPRRRRYTVRHWNAAERALWLDIVVHGAVGVGGPWAATAQPGDALVFTGPSGSYRPDPDAEWHLLAGDESALPAIAASLEAVPAGVPAVVRVVIDGPDHEVPLTSPGALDVVWLHRTGDVTDEALLPVAIADLDWPAGRVHAFVHGEAGEVRRIRQHLLAERGVCRGDGPGRGPGLLHRAEPSPRARRTRARARRRGRQAGRRVMSAPEDTPLGLPAVGCSAERLPFVARAATR